MKTRHFPHTQKKIFSSILYENDHDLSNGRSRSLAFFKYKRTVESLFGISNHMNGNATVSWPKSSLYTYNVHFHCANLWPWPSKHWKSCNKHFWNLLVKMTSLIYINLDLQRRQVWSLCLTIWVNEKGKQCICRRLLYRHLKRILAI